MFSVVILFHHWFPLLEKVEIRAFILPRNFPEALIIFPGRGTPLPRGTGRPSLVIKLMVVIMMVMVVTGHLGCGVEGLRGRRLSGPRPGWATAIKYPPQPLPPLVRWAPTRQGPHLTLTKQQVGWGTRLGPNPSGGKGFPSEKLFCKLL